MMDILDEMKFVDEESDVNCLKAAIRSLRERFDTVQIFATREKGKSTVNVNWGEGNWFARYGHVKLWCIREEHDDMERKDEGS
jgi:hypothetical protein